MAKTKLKHPIRRVRDSLKQAPKEFGLRKYATANGFAKLLGRSPSHLRNIECGTIDNWEHIASLIEKKTKVSSKWLLTETDPNAPILDINGKVWKPERHMDPLASRLGMPDWRFLLQRNPVAIPEIISRTIKAQIILEMTFGDDESLSSMVSFFENAWIFRNPATEQVLSDVVKKSSDQMLEMAFNANKNDGAHLEQKYGIKLAEADIDDLEKILDGEGYGWANSNLDDIDNLPKGSMLKEARQHYQKKKRV